MNYPKDPPETIYLQWHHHDPDFEGISWCQDRINDDDVTYHIQRKKYYLFGGLAYDHTCGGMADYKGVFDSLDEAKAAQDPPDQWADIVTVAEDGNLILVAEYGSWWNAGKGWMTEWRHPKPDAPPPVARRLPPPTE
jgi:hypothetical protein